MSQVKTHQARESRGSFVPLPNAMPPPLPMTPLAPRPKFPAEASSVRVLGFEMTGDPKFVEPLANALANALTKTSGKPQDSYRCQRCAANRKNMAQICRCGCAFR